MSCIACECYAKRITNIFRDDELRLKYTELTNCRILKDCFICDDCNKKLEAAFAFRGQCIDLYNKLNPAENFFGEVKGQEGIFIVNDEEETLLVEKETEEQYTETVNDEQDPDPFKEAEQDPEEQFEDVFLEFEAAEQEVEEAYVKPRTRRSAAAESNKFFIRMSYTVEQKLKIIEYAEQNNNRAAARHFNMNESSIRCFRRQKHVLLKMHPEEKTNHPEEQFEDVFLEFEAAEQEVEEAYVKPRSFSKFFNRKSYTVEQKLKIIEYAEKNNNRAAARHFHMNESSIRCFRRQKHVLLKMHPEKKTNRKAFPHWPALEKELKEFVENYPREHGVKAKLKDIKQRALEIAEKNRIDNFNGSNSYIFKFMQRHSLPSASPRPRKKFEAENEALLSPKVEKADSVLILK